MHRVDRLGLLEVEAGRVRVHPLDRERLDHLVHREDVAVLRDRPAEQREVVEQPLGQEAAVTVAQQVRLRVALGQLLVALPHHVGQVAEPWRPPGADAELGQRVVERELARGRRQQVLATQHVGDLHERVVDGVDQGVERMPAAAHQHVVGDVLGLEGDLAADQVVEGDRVVGHPEPHHRPPALLLVGGALVVGQRAAVAVVPRGAPLGAGPLVALVELLLRAVAVVGPTGLEEPGSHVGVDVVPLGLAVRRERAAHLRPLVPVEPEPPHDLEQGLVGLDRVAGGVGVLDAEHEGAAVVPGERPVEERGAGEADVRRAGRRRAEPHAHRRRRSGRVVDGCSGVSHGRSPCWSGCRGAR